MRKALIGLIALAITVPAFAQEDLYPERSDVRRTFGMCHPDSRKAAGTLRDDISQPQFHRMYFCNYLQIQKLPGERVVFAFSQFGSEKEVIAFEARKIDREVYAVDAIHYGIARVPADEGACRLFFDKQGRLDSLTCGGHATRDGNQYAPTVGFVVQH